MSAKATETGLLTAMIAALIVALGVWLGPKTHHATDQIPQLTHPTPGQAISQAVGGFTDSPFALVLGALFVGLAVALVVTAWTGRKDDDQ